MRLPIYQRCSASLWLTAHDPILETKADDKYSVQWRCRSCWKVVGETTARPKFRLMASLVQQRQHLKKARTA